MRLLLKFIKKLPATFIGFMVVMLLFIFTLGLSWIVTCGIIKLLTVLFGWSFSWSIATAIWLIMILLK